MKQSEALRKLLAGERVPRVNALLAPMAANGLVKLTVQGTKIIDVELTEWGRVVAKG